MRKEIFRAAREELRQCKRPWKSKDQERLCAKTARLGGQWYLSESQGKTVVQGWEAETQGSETAGSHKACTCVCSAQETAEWDVKLPYVFADAPSVCAPLMDIWFEIGSEYSGVPGRNSWEFTDLRCCPNGTGQQFYFPLSRLGYTEGSATGDPDQRSRQTHLPGCQISHQQIGRKLKYPKSDLVLALWMQSGL